MASFEWDAQEGLASGHKCQEEPLQTERSGRGAQMEEHRCKSPEAGTSLAVVKKKEGQWVYGMLERQQGRGL